jgi:hypothetical protein
MRDALFKLIVDIFVFQHSSSFHTNCDGKYSRDSGINT